MERKPAASNEGKCDIGKSFIQLLEKAGFMPRHWHAP